MFKSEAAEGRSADGDGGAVWALCGGPRGSVCEAVWGGSWGRSTGRLSLHAPDLEDLLPGPRPRVRVGREVAGPSGCETWCGRPARDACFSSFVGYKSRAPYENPDSSGTVLLERDSSVSGWGCGWETRAWLWVWCSSYVQPRKGNRRLTLSYFCQKRARLPAVALTTSPSLAHVPASPKVSRVCGGTSHFPSNSEDCVGHVWPEPRQLGLLRAASCMLHGL